MAIWAGKLNGLETMCCDTFFRGPGDTFISNGGSGSSSREDDPASKPILTSGRDMRTGQRREDGTIYLGYFKDIDGIRKDFFVASEDLKDNSGKRLAMNFNQASCYVASLEIDGQHDWRMPEDYILEKQYKAKNRGSFAGTYDVSGSTPGSLYWSAKLAPITRGSNKAINFKDGPKSMHSPAFPKSVWNVPWTELLIEEDVGSVRPVRVEPRLKP